MKREPLRARKKFALTVTQRDAARKNARLALLKAPVERARTTPQGSGLAVWRRRKAEEKERQVAELERLREDAVTVMRDGREFRVVRIPDRYGERRDGA